MVLVVLCLAVLPPPVTGAENLCFYHLIPPKSFAILGFLQQPFSEFSSPTPQISRQIIQMARAKKSEEKVKEGATLSIDVDSFVRTRDSVSRPPSLLSSSS